LNIPTRIRLIGVFADPGLADGPLK
jgi:hypothetical protein